MKADTHTLNIFISFFLLSCSLAHNIRSVIILHQRNEAILRRSVHVEYVENSNMSTPPRPPETITEIQFIENIETTIFLAKWQRKKKWFHLFGEMVCSTTCSSCRNSFYSFLFYFSFGSTKSELFVWQNCW